MVSKGAFAVTGKGGPCSGHIHLLPRTSILSNQTIFTYERKRAVACEWVSENPPTVTQLMSGNISLVLYYKRDGTQLSSLVLARRWEGHLLRRQHLHSSPFTSFWFYSNYQSCSMWVNWGMVTMDLTIPNTTRAFPKDDVNCAVIIKRATVPYKWSNARLTGHKLWKSRAFKTQWKIYIKKSILNELMLSPKRAKVI